MAASATPGINVEATLSGTRNAAAGPAVDSVATPTLAYAATTAASSSRKAPTPREEFVGDVLSRGFSSLPPALPPPCYTILLRQTSRELTLNGQYATVICAPCRRSSDTTEKVLGISTLRD